ncbi:MAG: sulfatase [Gammaproteobacteria bacterium]
MKRREALKTLLAAMALPSLLPSQLALGAIHKGATSQAKRPNIILILADDLGYGQLGCDGNRFNETPNLDRIAREGLRFSNAYASAAVCSPTRAALMTGQHPARQGITDYLARDDEHYLSPSYVTINERLKSAGYATGLIGKWHLTGDYDKNLGAPHRHGWDEVLLSETRYIASGAYFAPYSFMPRVEPREPNEYLTDRLNAEAVDFIRRHRDEPFFLYLSHYAVHKTLAAKGDVIAKYAAKPGAGSNGNDPLLAAMLESIDDGVGQILHTLKDLGLDDNTLIVFTSDNGGEMPTAPLRTVKSTLYEGGIRVPLVMRYPAGMRAGAVSHTPVVTHDFYPTFMELADVRSPARQPVDGISLTPLFSGPYELSRNTLYWHYPRAKPHALGGRSSGAIRYADYKLIEFFDTGEVELYDLRHDIGESKNLAAAMPRRVAELRDMLGAWRVSTHASMEPMRTLAMTAARR